MSFCFKEDDETSDSRFCQLVMLYGEFIRLDVFSHDTYLCTLISRGDLEPSPAVGHRPESGIPENNLTSHEGTGKVESRHQEILLDSSAEVYIYHLFTDTHTHRLVFDRNKHILFTRIPLSVVCSGF